MAPEHAAKIIPKLKTMVEEDPCSDLVQKTEPYIDGLGFLLSEESYSLLRSLRAKIFRSNAKAMKVDESDNK
ncbi:unnamed protein product [Amoebophrya sp. A25]|nr:unnamed protein product [Amoebophrya sp. A25]|eukprot:GSA25T00017808001.1